MQKMQEQLSVHVVEHERFKSLVCIVFPLLNSSDISHGNVVYDALVSLYATLERCRMRYHAERGNDKTINDKNSGLIFRLSPKTTMLKSPLSIVFIRSFP
jgi:hypothetical protein